MTPGLRFVKMSGAGNDFVVLGPEERNRIGEALPSWTRQVCRRGVSVGADGVLVVEALARARVRVVFLNPDGQGAFCANGSRCAARFAFVRGYAGRSMVLETEVGEVEATVEDCSVRIVLPPPRDLGEVSVEACGRVFQGRWIDSGVPHFVTPVGDVHSIPLESWGPALRRHPRFGSEGVNVDLLAPGEKPGTLSIRTWERGVEGETLSCGSGAVAAAFLGYTRGTRTPLLVIPKSGIVLSVDFRGTPEAPEAAILEGDARIVFEGTLADEDGQRWPA